MENPRIIEAFIKLKCFELAKFSQKPNIDHKILLSEYLYQAMKISPHNNYKNR